MWIGDAEEGADYDDEDDDEDNSEDDGLLMSVNIVIELFMYAFSPLQITKNKVKAVKEKVRTVMIALRLLRVLSGISISDKCLSVCSRRKRGRWRRRRIERCYRG